MRTLLRAGLLAALLTLLVASGAAANNHTLHRCRANHSRHYCHKHGFHRTRYATGWEHGVASWYQDGGQTASGWHATYGFADCANYRDHCWPMGTVVRFCWNGRCINATADDHGPYVSGRDFDLGQSTAAAIGFSGVHRLSYRVVRYG
jgi:rare lipoprotein A (peptidoglycan hydrolase)